MTYIKLDNKCSCGGTVYAVGIIDTFKKESHIGEAICSNCLNEVNTNTEMKTS